MAQLYRGLMAGMNGNITGASLSNANADSAANAEKDLSQRRPVFLYSFIWSIG